MAIDYRVANDNVPKQSTPHVKEPAGISSTGEALRARAYASSSVTSRDSSLTLSSPDSLMDYSPVWSPRGESGQSKLGGFGLKASLTAWVLSIAAIAWSVYTGAPGVFHLIAVIALMWASIAMGYFASRRGNRAGTELSALSALLAFAGTIYVIAAHFGILAPPAISAATLATGALALGVVLRSQICVRLAVILAIAGLAAGMTMGGPALLFWAAPVFGGLTCAAAIAQNDEAAFNLSHLLVYGWIGAALAIAVSGGFIPAIHGAALFFAAAAAQHRIGRLMQDKARPFGEPAAAWGWALSMAGLIGITDFWLRGDSMPWVMNTLDPVGLAVFIGLALCAVTVILLAEIRRVITRPQSPLLALSAAVICAVVIFAPLYAPMIAQLDMVSLSDIELSTSQATGLLFAGAAFAISCIYGVNGALRVQPLRVIAALAALGALAVAALDHLLITPEALMIFGVAAFVSILTAIGFIKPRA